MKHKSGNIIFGIFAPIFSLVCIALGITTLHKDLVLAIFFLAFGGIVLVFGSINLIRWLLDRQVLLRGEKTYGTVTKLGSEKADKTNLYSEGNCYYLEFSYQVDSNNETVGVLVTKDIFDKLNVGDRFPIITYKRRAVVDYKTLRAEMESH